MENNNNTTCFWKIKCSMPSNISDEELRSIICYKIASIIICEENKNRTLVNSI